LNLINCDNIIEINEVGDWTGVLALNATYQNSVQKTCAMAGIDGGIYLHTATEKDKSYSVKLIDNVLILSLGFTFLSFDIDKQEIKWKVRPDSAQIFEFYDLENDFLVRGEIEIHRIDLDGNIKWSYGGRDIWVSIDGKKEVQVEQGQIHLTDFAGNEYVIDFDGKTLEDKPVALQNHKPKKWWQI
jgi:hypothetical protein